jgi:hypothetical protein
MYSFAVSPRRTHFRLHQRLRHWLFSYAPPVRKTIEDANKPPVRAPIYDANAPPVRETHRRPERSAEAPIDDVMTIKKRLPFSDSPFED